MMKRKYICLGNLP